MLEIYSNKNLYNKLINNSRKIIVERYNQQKIRSLIYTEYNNLLSRLNKN